MINSGKARLNFERQLQQREKRLTNTPSDEMLFDSLADDRHIQHMLSKR